MTLYKDMGAYEKARYVRRKMLVRESHILIEKIWPHNPKKAYTYLAKRFGDDRKYKIHFTYMDLNEVEAAYQFLREKAIDEGKLRPKNTHVKG